MNYLDERIEKIRKAMDDKADAILITSSVTRKYAFNIKSSAGFGVITKDRCLFFIDFRYYEKLKLLQEDGKISYQVEINEPTAPRNKMLCEIISQCHIKTMLFEDRAMTYAEFSALNDSVGKHCGLVPMKDTLEKLRAVKDEYELSCIMKAQSITDMAFSHILGYIKKGMTEKDVALELEFFMRKNGADGISFDTICVSGKKSSMPHGEPDDTVIGDGFLTMDYGASFDGYCSDMTRTVCIGEPTSEMRRIYETVLEAQNAAFSAIHGGVIGKNVDMAARDVINKKGYEGCFGHGLGHSLGLEIHESPNFNTSEAGIIPEKAVLSVEPGIYISGKCGVRIEDIVFLTENGYKNLTNSTKEFIIIK